MTQRVYETYENDYGHNYVYPSERMYVRTSVYLPSSEIDPRTGHLRPDNPKRGRTQAKKLEYVHLDKEYKQLDAALKARKEHPGIRISLRAAICLVLCAAFFCGLSLLIRQGTLAEKQETMNRVYKGIEIILKTNADLAGKIADASNSATICYTATRRLNMIPGEAVTAIHLVAMDTRPLEATAISAIASAEVR